eukprot:TRINITY_DN4211_c0_g1_i1.p1 TRINITY_DN4211_c0_g1~~TRINITY_DN4211_c0_g1_i1.p1  ORF type:complete len:142 (-),score=34.88 TRINITY_DN4211_c0_g1_i1:55-480(-)
MSGMLKKNFLMVISQAGMGAWVSYFFAGFVLAKLPFPLTPRFKAMLQRGIELSSLDSSYVSSLSWYFLAAFGLRGLTSLVLGENEIDEAKLMQAQMGAPMGMAMGGTDSKVYQSEKENLELVNHVWSAGDAEQRLLRKSQA